MKVSSLLKVFDGNRLVGLIDGCNNADKQPLDLFEKEILRIFTEHKQLQAENVNLRAELEEEKRDCAEGWRRWKLLKDKP